MISRRQFLNSVTAGTLFLAGCRSPFFSTHSRRKPSFRVLYSNDTTNITSCVSPWHRKGEPFRPKMLEATIDEAAGVDAHLLQPGLCWVPWWKSKTYPVEDHYRWMKDKYGVDPDSFGRYMIEGGDIVKVFVDRCRMRGQAPFISFRLNDGHHKEWVDAKPGEKVGGGASQGITRFYHEHPEYRIGSDLNNWNQRVHDWVFPEVRAHKLAFIRELCENYDIDGLELDFLRHCSLFQFDKTTREQRCSIMTGFVKQVRDLLDRTVKPGQHRWLCVRIPCYLAAHDLLGIDVAAFADAGVEMFNLSSYYVFEQQTDVAAVRKLVPSSAVYAEMTHTTRVGPKVSSVSGYDDFSFRRTADEQFYTTAHLAYARDLDGVSTFNFVYYRDHGTPLRGPFGEPPFHIFKHLKDPSWLAKQPQYYFITRAHDAPPVPNRQMGSKKPRTVKTGVVTDFVLDMAPPAGGWEKGGVLRVQTNAPMQKHVLAARLNGLLLKPTKNVAEPYVSPHMQLLGTADKLRAWTVPAEVLCDGKNRVEFTIESGGSSVELVFLDLAVR
ncbi:MAG: hypothetical protein A2283_06585 [Lentisphaerae bacterium RIFOXYA12_FULL_48_11]|nr:MAG: hypothetical protein A2283_06585 [Lentisphaerae bacterium RIFOXYA12_FULL_48_11]